MTTDFTINEPKQIETANCICARVDCGISNYKQSGSCVVEEYEKANSKS